MLKLIIGLILMLLGFVGGFLAKDGWSDIQKKDSKQSKNKNEVESSFIKPSSRHKEKINDVESSEIQVGISYGEVIDTLSDKGKSSLQIQKFVNNNQGNRVTWKVIVADVKPSFDQNTLYLIFSRVDNEKLIPVFSTAVFNQEEESNLTPISEGDIVLIEGEMSFRNSYDWTVDLENSKLIKHY